MDCYDVQTIQSNSPLSVSSVQQERRVNLIKSPPNQGQFNLTAKQHFNNFSGKQGHYIDYATFSRGNEDTSIKHSNRSCASFYGLKSAQNQRESQMIAQFLRAQYINYGIIDLVDAFGQMETQIIDLYQKQIKSIRNLERKKDKENRLDQMNVDRVSRFQHSKEKTEEQCLQSSPISSSQTLIREFLLKIQSYFISGVQCSKPLKSQSYQIQSKSNRFANELSTGKKNSLKQQYQSPKMIESVKLDNFESPQRTYKPTYRQTSSDILSDESQQTERLKDIQKFIYVQIQSMKEVQKKKEKCMTESIANIPAINVQEEQLKKIGTQHPQGSDHTGCLGKQKQPILIQHSIVRPLNLSQCGKQIQRKQPSNVRSEKGNQQNELMKLEKFSYNRPKNSSQNFKIAPQKQSQICIRFSQSFEKKIYQIPDQSNLQKDNLWIDQKQSFEKPFPSSNFLQKVYESFKQTARTELQIQFILLGKLFELQKSNSTVLVMNNFVEWVKWYGQLKTQDKSSADAYNSFSDQYVRKKAQLLQILKKLLNFKKAQASE